MSALLYWSWTPNRKIRFSHVVILRRTVQKVARWRYHTSSVKCTSLTLLPATFPMLCYGVAVLVYIRSVIQRHRHIKLNVPSVSTWTCPCCSNWNVGQSSTLDLKWPQSAMQNVTRWWSQSWHHTFTSFLLRSTAKPMSWLLNFRQVLV